MTRYDGRLPSSFLEAERMLGNGDNKHTSVNKTRIIRNGSRISDPISVRHHQTDIATFFQDGGIRFTDGGWNSTATCARLQAMAPPGFSFSKRGGGIILLHRGAPEDVDLGRGIVIRHGRITQL